MALPLYLALSRLEMDGIHTLPPHPAYMACHFSPGSDGISNCPVSLPENTLLIHIEFGPFQPDRTDTECGVMDGNGFAVFIQQNRFQIVEFRFSVSAGKPQTGIFNFEVQASAGEKSFVFEGEF